MTDDRCQRTEDPSSSRRAGLRRGKRVVRNSAGYQMVLISEYSRICLSDVTSGSPRILAVAAMGIQQQIHYFKT